jgi:hypothetical protein
MKLSTLFEMPPEEIEDIEAKIKKDFLSVNIVLNFTKHFGSRIVDGAVEGSGDHTVKRDKYLSRRADRCLQEDQGTSQEDLHRSN